jgi:hypothetical protein
VVLELVQRHSPDVVAVRAELEQVAGGRVGRRVLEGPPLRAEVDARDDHGARGHDRDERADRGDRY